MGLIIYLIVGGIVGWLASIIMKRDGQQGIILNIIVGIVGTFIGNWVSSNFLGIGGGIDSGFSLQSFGVSLIGALILLAIVNLIYRGKAR